MVKDVLTREQLEHAVDRIIKPFHPTFAPYRKQVLDHDAALRAQLAQVGIDKQDMIWERDNLLEQLAKARTQLAQVTTERDAFRASFEQESEKCKRFYAKWDEKIATIPPLQARVTELEATLKYLAIELSAGSSTLYREKAILKCDQDWLLNLSAKAQAALKEREGI